MLVKVKERGGRTLLSSHEGNGTTSRRSSVRILGGEEELEERRLMKCCYASGVARLVQPID
jgi:hypothetical protein